MILALKASRSSAEDISLYFASIITTTSFVCDDHAGHAEWNNSMALSISKELDLLLEHAENLHQKLRSSVSLVKSDHFASLHCARLTISSYQAFSTWRVGTRYRLCREPRKRRTRKWRRSLLVACKTRPRLSC